MTLSVPFAARSYPVELFDDLNQKIPAHLSALVTFQLGSQPPKIQSIQDGTLDVFHFYMPLSWVQPQIDLTVCHTCINMIALFAFKYFTKKVFSKIGE